jgi:hypothetical protein
MFYGFSEQFLSFSLPYSKGINAFNGFIRNAYVYINYYHDIKDRKLKREEYNRIISEMDMYLYSQCKTEKGTEFIDSSKLVMNKTWEDMSETNE